MTIALMPIFMVEGRDVVAFSSVEEAEGYLEAWWVNEKRGEMFDAAGNALIPRVSGSRVSLSYAAALPNEKGRLAAALRAHLIAKGEGVFADGEYALPELVDAIMGLHPGP